MILANTKVTGYSLGLPLFWPEDPTQLSTGIIQGISISLVLPTGIQAPALFINKYSLSDNHLTLGIGSADAIICSLDVDLSEGFFVYPLQAEDDSFLGGWVGLYGISGERLLNLRGAQINPFYIHASYQNSPDFGSFTLVDNVINQSGGASTAWLSGGIVSSGATISTNVVSTAALEQLVMSDSPDVFITSNLGPDGGIVYVTNTDSGEIVAEGVDNISIRYINGIPVSGGTATINLPDTWVVMGNNLCARVGNPSNVPSCVAVDVIHEDLGPQNFPGTNPLEVAFSGGVLDLTPIYNGTVRFNADYELGSDSSAGLVWSEFSQHHDALT